MHEDGCDCQTCRLRRSWEALTSWLDEAMPRLTGHERRTVDRCRMCGHEVTEAYHQAAEAMALWMRGDRAEVLG
jgi:hypothetical protein